MSCGGEPGGSEADSSQNQSRNQARAFLNENQDKMIFVMGTGRSGTQLLSDLLDSAGTAKVFHEPNFWEDVSTMDILRRNPELAVQYWKEFRSLEVYRRWMEKPVAQMYGEVNGTIRYQAPAIKQIFPNAKMLMVVRDGRGVVRSVMGWPQFYGPGSNALNYEPRHKPSIGIRSHLFQQWVKHLYRLEVKYSSLFSSSRKELALLYL